MGEVTIRDVAREANVSVATVSQVLNGKGRISEGTRTRVEQAVQRLGYIPNSRARTMRSMRSHTVALVVPDISNAFFSTLVDIAQSRLFEAGYSTLIGIYSNNPKRQDDLLRNLYAQQIDGAIVVPQGDPSPALAMLAERGLPMVFIDRRQTELPDVPLIDSDPHQGMFEALMDIKRHGHHRIGFVSGPSYISQTVFAERERSFLTIAGDLFGKENLCVDVIDPDGSRPQINAVLERMFHFGASALVFGYSPSAIAAAGVIQANGQLIGQDISIVSFDDVMVFRLMTPAVSTISQQMERISIEGANMLTGMIEHGQRPPTLTRTPTFYVPRESVGLR